MKRLNVVYFGTPDFSVPTLDLLANHPLINIVSVVSMPDRKSGRGLELKSPEVIEYSKNNKINFFQTENINKEDEYLQELETKEIDIFIVLAFAQFLGQRVLSIPKQGAFNIHTSLLPKYRGAAPIQYALLNGDSTTGVSIQRMVKKMDAGDVCHSKPIEVASNETGGQLYTRLKFQAALSANEFISDFIQDKLQFKSQDETLVSFAPTLKKNDGFLDFKNMTYQQITNIIRALDPWPGSYCFLDKKRLKVFSILTTDLSLKPGELFYKNGFLNIGTKDKTIRLNSIQIEGKARSTDIEFLNGIKKEFTINPEV